jgi:hypothetical protein
LLCLHWQYPIPQTRHHILIYKQEILLQAPIHRPIVG